MPDDLIWKTKLAARVHDPAEKALVLLRDPEGHEGGTSHALKRLLGFDQPPEHIDPDNEEALSRVIFKKGLPFSIYRHVQRADWWAAAADRPQWPMQEITLTTKNGEQKTLKVADWAQVRWAKDPVLIHPLTGEQYRLPGGLSETDIRDIKERSFRHFSQILVALGAQDESPQDLRKALLAFWRFGPELTEDEGFGKLGELWKLLPADTRIPDHSIWDHLDLTSAFAGAFAADAEGEIALLAVSIGPVQPFIAAARKMDALWAGSHLLSRLAWEAMRPLCESFGPDAILFPRLRGIPQVDLWLRDQMDLPDKLFERCEWLQSATDANPLFSAALPNRFVAVVPASQIRQIAQQVTEAVREWLRQTGGGVVSRLLHVAGLDVEAATPYDQMKAQLRGFPEVHWAAVPFSLIRARNIEKQTDLDVAMLSEAIAPFFGGDQGKPCGFLDTPAWQVLQKDMVWDDNTTFFTPNPGVLYPAVYDLVERVMAAAKAARTFDQAQQEGWRCSLTGEAEWLTADLVQLAIPPGSRKDTLWTRVSSQKPAWARKGEHLGALAATKRLWPTIFAEEVRKALGSGEGGKQRPGGRFVVSTHTMALAHQLDRWVENGGVMTGDLGTGDAESVALPRRLMRHKDKAAIEQAKHIPGLLETARERDREDNEAYERARRQVCQTLAQGSAHTEEVKLEAYYALIMMDGDRMGAILSGDEKNTISFGESLHPQVQKGFDEQAARQGLIRRYGKQNRPISPNRHLAISGALNDFSQTVVRHVVEEEHLGRVIYAGGDDVLAMLPVADMLSAMQRLRHAYSGIDPDHEGGVWHGLTLQSGFAVIKAGHGDRERVQLMRMMGRNATASCGAVIAHHQAPLSAVMRELRAAEKRAKNEGGRDAFSITVIKRSGGALRLTEKWDKPIALLNALIAFLRAPGVSRRAVYNTLEWLHDLPDPKESPDMLESLIAYQFGRQVEAREKQKVLETHDVPGLAGRIATLTARQPKDRLKWLENFLTVAEFLARETRGGDEHEAAKPRGDAA